MLYYSVIFFLIIFSLFSLILPKPTIAEAIATVGIFNNRFIVWGNFRTNLFHNKWYSNFNFIFFLVFFIAVIDSIIFMMYIVSLFPKFFHATCKHIFIYLRLALYIFMTVLYLRYIWLYSILVKLSGDVEENPGPKPKSCQSFWIYHWKVNSVYTIILVKFPF